MVQYCTLLYSPVFLSILQAPPIGEWIATGSHPSPGEKSSLAVYIISKHSGSQFDRRLRSIFVRRFRVLDHAQGQNYCSIFNTQQYDYLLFTAYFWIIITWRLDYCLVVCLIWPCTKWGSVSVNIFPPLAFA